MDNVAFTVFGFNIYWYAVMIVTGMVGAMLIASYLLKKKGYKADLVIDVAILTLPLAIIGARLYYVLFTLDRSWSLAEIINIRSGGLAIYGGVIGGAAGVFAVCLIKKFKFDNILDVIDAIVPGLLFGQALGRWGNFFNQEAYGNPVTDKNLQFFPYAVFIESENAFFQATFFYESALNFIGCILLFILSRRLNGKYKGLPVCGYFIYYGLVRAFVEGLRSDSLYWGPFRVSQILSMLLIAAGIALAAIIFIRNKKAVKDTGSKENKGPNDIYYK